MTIAERILYYCRYATRPEWTHELHRSVRLHLALSEPGLSTQAVLATLRVVELNLCQQLLASDPASAASPKAVNTATIVVQMYQTALLSHPAECETLHRELSIAEFRPALPPTCGPYPMTEVDWPLPGAAPQ